jgi:hypothetical protein
MQSWRSARDRRLATVTILGILLVLRPAPAQQATPLTLDQILQRLEDNLRNYDAQVPSFICDEHVTSKKSSDSGNKDTYTDSVFRLKRIPNPDDTTRLVESRDIKTVNGKSAAGEDIHGPTSLGGAFSAGLALVSLNQKACMNYTLQPIKSKRSYIIRFATMPASERPASCLLQEDATGRVIIDPVTTQITRMEFHVPHHVIAPKRKLTFGTIIPPAVGSWDLSIDYASVVLDGHTFWVPMTIDSSMSDRSEETTWSFTAHYTNYHKLEVSSRIVPLSDPQTDPPPPP